MHMLEQLNAPVVTLAGQKWPVRLMVARQNKIVDPLILKLLELFASGEAGGRLAALSEQDYEALLRVAYVAIQPGKPELSWDMFLDMPITLPELVEAFPVIARQTGVFARGAPGEAQAGNAPNGTASSPMSAT